MTRLWPAGEPVRVEGTENTPSEFSWRGTRHPIKTVRNRWRLHTRWWEPGQAIWREYLKIETETGILCLLYCDLMEGGWFLARIYD
jgi:hypothetical protein